MPELDFGGGVGGGGGGGEGVHHTYYIAKILHTYQG